MIRQQDGLAILNELEQGSTVEMSFSTVQVGSQTRFGYALSPSQSESQHL